MTEKYGKGFRQANLYHFIAFYNYHQNFFYAVSRKSEEADEEEIFHAVSRKSENILQLVTAKSPIRLSWTHYRIILQESNKEARDWYEQEAAREMWGTRTLQRNVSSQYYHRLLQSQMMLPQGHNPTIGLILCADTDDDVAHYSVLNGSDQLFAAKYLTYMPSRADLRREIEQQKEFFLLQHKGENKD